jgi:phosphoenolpyruvate-protein kinase (PTS system EI component)
VVVRLFDAGGDKPLRWLAAPDAAPGLRGIELLFMHPAVLEAQLRAMVRASEGADVRVLVPLVSSTADVERVRALTAARISVGAMIETPTAVDRCDAISRAADFVCIGTNDLSAQVTGQTVPASTLSLDPRLLRMIARVASVAHAHGRRVTVCGEMAGEPHGARVLVGLGVDAISVAPTRFARVKLALRDMTREECRGLASEALRSAP